MSFSAPLFLIGLVAVAIPIVVHLFNFRRYKKVYFSNVERLEQLQSETRRQSSLRQLLILATRIMAIVFLVLAFARPVLPGNNGQLRIGSNDVSIFLDNSFSMGSSDGDRPLLDKAKEKAREIVAAYSASDRFQLLTGDMEGRHFHWLTQEEMLLQIDEVELSGASPTLADVVERQIAFLHEGTSQNRNAFILSDFQASMVAMETFPADSDVQVTFVPLEAADQGNVYVDSVVFNAPVYQRGSQATVEVWLRNEDDENLEKVPVVLYLNDKQRAMASPDLASHATTVVPLHFTVDQTGVLSGRIEIMDYPVTFDDQYFFSLNVRDRVRGLLVEGNGKNEFLQRLFENDSSVMLSVVGIQQMDFSRMEGNDFVLLDELPSLSSGMAQSLHSFVMQGGTLMVVPSESADVEGYNAALSLFGAPQLGGLHKGRVSAGVIHTDHALYRNVFSSKTDDLEMPSVTDYQRLTATGATLKESIVTLANGDDYLVATPCGSGRLYLVAAPLRDTHTDFIRQALFVPTFYNMALYSVRPMVPATTLGSADPVLLSQRFEGEVVKMVSTSGDYEGIPDLRRTGGISSLVLHEDPSVAGNYLLFEEGVETPVEGLSLNYSRLESQMSFLGRDALSSLIKDYNLRNCSVVRNVDKPLDSYLKEQLEGRSLWRWCLVLSLLMLLAEILLIRLPIAPSHSSSHKQ